MPVYKNSNGKGYRVRINYVDEYGTKRQITRSNERTATLRGAKEYEAALVQEFSKGKGDYVVNINMTFNQLYEEYCRVKNGTLRHNTLRQTDKDYRMYFKPYFGKRKIFEISTDDIIRWKQRFQDEHPDFKIGYLNTIYKNLTKILNFGKQYFNLPKNPATLAKKFTDPNAFEINELEDEDGISAYWTLDEFMLFYRCVDSEIENTATFQEKIWKSNFLTFFTILFFAGLRKGECFALTWNRIRTKNGKKNIYVRKSMSQEVTPFEITDPKNKSSIRYVPICDFLQHQLDKHRALYERVYLFEKDWFICGGLKPIWKTTCNNFKNKYEKLLGIHHIKIHGLRHSFASLLINGNVNIKTISKLMGHATVEQTWNTYAHLYPDTENEAIEYINRCIQR